MMGDVTVALGPRAYSEITKAVGSSMATRYQIPMDGNKIQYMGPWGVVTFDIRPELITAAIIKQGDDKVWIEENAFPDIEP